MTRGIVIAHFDETKGLQTVTQYPQDVRISDSDLINIYARHINAENSSHRLIESVKNNIKYLSYCSGPRNDYFFILVTDIEEIEEQYEDGFIESIQLLIKNLQNNQYMDDIALFYSNIERYYLLNDEQKLSWLFQDDLRKIILQLMRKIAVVEKQQLVEKIKEIYNEDFFDIEPVLMSLEKSSIIRVEEIDNENFVFLLKDIIFERIPPVDQYDTIDSRGLPSKLKKSYQHEVDKFFSGYNPSEEDALDIIEKVILDTQIYESLKLLRVACITRDDFEDLAAKGVRDVDYILKMLWETNMILVLQGEDDTEYYCLKSDFYVKPFFPSYLLNVIKIVYQNKMGNPKALVREIQILKSMYSELFSSIKLRTEKSKKEIETDIYLNH
jgi:hypothetical protein